MLDALLVWGWGVGWGLLGSEQQEYWARSNNLIWIEQSEANLLACHTVLQQLIHVLLPKQHVSKSFLDKAGYFYLLKYTSLFWLALANCTLVKFIFCCILVLPSCLVKLSPFSLLKLDFSAGIPKRRLRTSPPIPLEHPTRDSFLST